MKLRVLLVVLAVTQVVQSSKQKQKGEETNRTDKRALEEGNAGLKAQYPAFTGPVPGIEYADSGNSEKYSDNSESHQKPILSTPLPQQTKISDVITGQGPPYQAAIVSHLYSPFSVYQPRLARYEVSAPVPAKLAYAEKITYQSTTSKPVVTGINYAKPTPPQSEQAIQTPRALIEPVRVAFGQSPQNPSVNQFYEVRPDYEYPMEAQFISKYHPNYLDTFPHNYKPGYHQVRIQYVPQQPTPVRTDSQSIQVSNVIPGVEYTKVEKKENLQNPLKELQLNRIPNIQPHVRQENGQVSYASQSENAISYASFSIAPTPTESQPEATPIVQYRPQYQLLEQAYQTRPPLYPEVYKPHQYLEPQIQQTQQHQPPHNTQHKTPIAVQQDFKNQYLQVHQLHRNPQFQLQGQHYQIQNKNQYQQSQNPITYFHKFPGHDVKVQAAPFHLKPDSLVSNHVEVSARPKLLYSYHPEPEVNQPQIYPPQALVVQNPQRPSNTYQNVQFHGKFAPEIFRDYKNAFRS